MLKKCYKHKGLIWNLILKELRLKYRGSFLGFFWTLLDPLFMIIILLLVFTKLFSYDILNYPAYLLIGVFVWNYFQEATTRGVNIFTEYANIITKTNIPKIILVIAINIFRVIDFVLKFLVLLIVLLILKFALNWPSLITINKGFLIIPLIIFLQFMLIMGLSLILGSIYIYYSDIAHVWGILMHIGFFITPIFYPASLIPLKYNFILTLNPLYHLIEIYRQIISNNYQLILTHTIIICEFIILFLVSGYIIFKKLEPKFAEKI